ncbi:MAG: EscU/YscU/HrcU family type III secretion system export apparatus switch protein [Myxococcaceae bacterium]|nr:EscU/YscU/HrcU family type III secretion system export apparatus switch protein [Myxococcaceae bacterium]MCI0671839.1 EscU/YscU/HrcU family type III secretion system export apparatus switch protein [Myxococcaceae bacterium]
MSEKTEQPTPQRLREARKKGQVARSRLLASAAVTLAASLAAAAVIPTGVARLRFLAMRMLGAELIPPTEGLSEALGLLVRLAAPVLAAALVASALVSVAFVGFEVHAEHVLPQLDRINPAAGLRRLFSLESLAEVARGLACVVLLAWLAWRDVRDGLPAMLGAVRLGGEYALLEVLHRVGGLALRCAGLLLLLGLLDWGLARHRHLRTLRMSREEVKQEHKQTEGDPHHKAHRKALHRQLAAGGPARGVQKATAVVVNPTHLAVALRYAPEECDAPYLVAKGQEEDALRLRREARALGIPVVRDIPLARSLIHLDVGEQVPEELYRAAAAVLVVAQQERSEDPHPWRRTT